MQTKIVHFCDTRVKIYRGFMITSFINNKYTHIHLGENMVKGAKGTKVKVFNSKDYMWHMALVHSLNFFILHT